MMNTNFQLAYLLLQVFQHFFFFLFQVYFLEADLPFELQVSPHSTAADLKDSAFPYRNFYQSYTVERMFKIYVRDFVASK